MPAVDPFTIEEPITVVHRTDELRFLNGVLQRKFVTVAKEKGLPVSTVESWEDIPSVTSP